MGQNLENENLVKDSSVYLDYDPRASVNLGLVAKKGDARPITLRTMPGTRKNDGTSD